MKSAKERTQRAKEKSAAEPRASEALVVLCEEWGAALLRYAERVRNPDAFAARTTEKAEEAREELPETDSLVGARKERLERWRREEARRRLVAPFFVLTNKTLELLATTPVATRSDLERIPGIGPRKIEEYGTDLLRLVRDEVVLATPTEGVLHSLRRARGVPQRVRTTFPVQE